VTHSPDDRSPLAQGIAWSTRVTAIALEMVVPGLIGLWIDRRLGTVAVFLFLGMILGVTTGILQLARLAASEGRGGPSDGKSSEDDARWSPRP